MKCQPSRPKVYGTGGNLTPSSLTWQSCLPEQPGFCLSSEVGTETLQEPGAGPREREQGTLSFPRKCGKAHGWPNLLKYLRKAVGGEESLCVHWPQSLLRGTQLAENTLFLGASSYRSGWCAAPANCVTWHTSG